MSYMVVRAVTNQQSAWVVEHGKLKGTKACSHHNGHFPACDVLSRLHVWKGDVLGSYAGRNLVIATERHKRHNAAPIHFSPTKLKVRPHVLIQRYCFNTPVRVKRMSEAAVLAS